LLGGGVCVRGAGRASARCLATAHQRKKFTASEKFPSSCLIDKASEASVPRMKRIFLISLALLVLHVTGPRDDLRWWLFLGAALRLELDITPRHTPGRGMVFLFELVSPGFYV